MSVHRPLHPAGFWATVPVAFAVGVAYAVVPFGPSFALGSSGYWRLPPGRDRWLGGRENRQPVC